MRDDSPVGSEVVLTMDIRELDRLVSKTELTPASKLMLRTVRKSAMSGRVRGPEMDDYKWSVYVEDFGSSGAKFTFALRRSPNDNTA